MTKQRRDAIYAIAGDIRSSLKLKTPVDLYSIIIEVLKGECRDELLEDDISGKIEKIENSFRITLNQNHPPNRKNFTMAHELGHLFLHMGYLIDKAKWETVNEYIDSPYYRMGYSEEEYEANHFAGALLMPKDEYRDFVNKNMTPQNRINVSLISDRFKVSEEAALTRGRWLGIFGWN